MLNIAGGILIAAAVLLGIYLLFYLFFGVLHATISVFEYRQLRKSTELKPQAIVKRPGTWVTVQQVPSESDSLRSENPLTGPVDYQVGR